MTKKVIKTRSGAIVGYAIVGATEKALLEAVTELNKLGFVLDDDKETYCCEEMLNCAMKFYL